MMDGDLEMRDATVASDGPQTPPLLLSEDETRILDMYDRLKDLQLEIALLRARHEHIPGRYSCRALVNGCGS